MEHDSKAVQEEANQLIRKLSSAMAGSKLSLRGWANIIGINPSALSAILRGDRDPLLSTYAKISVAVRKHREEE